MGPPPPRKGKIGEAVSAGGLSARAALESTTSASTKWSNSSDASTFRRRTSDPSLEPLVARLSNSDKLALYALFKQASFGDCASAHPSAFNMRARAKHDAWMGRRGLAQVEAMAAYLELLDAHAVKHGFDEAIPHQTCPDTDTDHMEGEAPHAALVVG